MALGRVRSRAAVRGVDSLERRAHVCHEKSMAECQGYAYCAYTKVGAAPFSPIMARRRRWLAAYLSGVGGDYVGVSPIAARRRADRLVAVAGAGHRAVGSRASRLSGRCLVWRPDPQTYADMTWPPATNVPAGATPAHRLYVENCAFCHGPDGRGNGASAPSMIPRPRDFTEGLFKYKSTPRAPRRATTI